MNKIINKISTEPVRVYAVTTAALALLSHYVPSTPTYLVLGLVAAILGLGESTRSLVYPWQHVGFTKEEADDLTEGLQELRDSVTKPVDQLALDFDHGDGEG